MNDKTVAPADDIKTAEVVGKGHPGGEAQPQAKPITFGQQLFIWTMVILVGVIFGAGYSATLLMGGSRTINGVGENDLLVRQDTARRLQDQLNPSRNRYMGEVFEAGYENLARQILLARYADAQGLTPTGPALEGLLKEFLATPVPMQQGRTYYDVLLERKGAKDEITPVALRRFLAERAALQALFARDVVVPAVPAVVADEVNRLMSQRISIDEVILSATHLLPTVAADDAEIQATYDRLRATRFARSARLDVTVAKADLAALAAAETVTEADVAAQYDAKKETFAKPQTDPAAAKEYRPLAEVSAELRTAIARERAEAKARVAIDAFNAVIEAKNLEGSDQAAFAAAAREAGLVVAPLAIASPEAGMIDLGALGRIKDPAGLFTKDAGFIANPMQGTADDKTWFVLRIDAVTPAGFKELAEVKEQVVRIVAGARAYPELLKQAEALRAAAAAQGPAGLSALVLDPAHAAWKAVATSPDIQAMTEFKAPASELGAAAGEPRMAVSLVPAEVLLAEVTGPAEDIPRVRLVQVREITPAPAVEEARRGDLVRAYRQELESYRARLLEQELRGAIGN